MKSLIKFLPAVALTMAAFCSYAQHKLVKQWETDSVLKVPESVLYDVGNKVLYVSNIDGKPDGKDGKGSIGKVGLDGRVIAAEWVTGLDAPKGMALVKNTLWVADLDQMVAINISTGEITKRIPVEGAIFLNDVAADTRGIVYVSDSRTKMVHKIENDKVSVYFKDLEGPNGLLVHRKILYVLDNGKLLREGKNKDLETVATNLEGHTDGVEHVENNEFIVSAWTGVIYYVKADGSVETLLDTRDRKINSADIGYDSKNRVVYVPTFFKNTVVAYKLQ